MARNILKAQGPKSSKRSKPELKDEACDGTGVVQLCCLTVLGAISSACLVSRVLVHSVERCGRMGRKRLTWMSLPSRRRERLNVDDAV